MIERTWEECVGIASRPEVLVATSRASASDLAVVILAAEKEFAKLRARIEELQPCPHLMSFCREGNRCGGCGSRKKRREDD